MSAKRILALTLAMVMIFALFAGCKKAEEPGNNQTPTDKTEDKPATGDGKVITDIIVGQSADVVSPDPHDQNDTSSNRVIRMMYNALLWTDFEAKSQPALAERWEVVDDNTYKFYLRKGVKWHNGYDFTAEDVKFSLDRQRNSPKVKSFVEAISEVIIDNEYEVTVKTAYPYAPLLGNLGNTQASIICKKYYEEMEAKGKKYAEAPIGTGPMIFKEWKPNNNFTVTRNDNYWGEKATATSVTMRVIPEEAARTIALEKGEIHMLDMVPAVDITRILENKDIKTVRQPSTAITYVSYNMTKEPFNKKEVRQALSYATNKQNMIDVILEGYGQEMNNVFPVTMPSYLDDLKPYPFDAEKAKALMAQAGYADGLNIEMATSGDERNRVAQLMQADFAAINVTLDIVLLEWGAYLEYISKKNHQMFIVGWSAGFEPDGSCTPLFHTDSGGPTGNRAWYSNPEVDALIDEGKSTLDMEKRIPIYEEIQRKVMEDAVWIPLFSKETVIAMRNGLEGILISPTESHWYIYASVKE